MNEYTTRIVSLTKITPSAATLRMEKPPGFTFRPGQWAYFTVHGDIKSESRSLSFSSSPTEPYLEFTKRLSDSDFCTIVEGCQEGDELSFTGPMGNLVYEGGLETVVFLAGGAPAHGLESGGRPLQEFVDFGGELVHALRP